MDAAYLLINGELGGEGKLLSGRERCASRQFQLQNPLGASVCGSISA
jgi:hypothetical protein